VGLGSCSLDVRGLPDFQASLLHHSSQLFTILCNFHHKIVKSPPQEELDVACLLIEKVAGETVGKQWPISAMHAFSPRAKPRARAQDSF
jgi:hypothetical protein